MSNITRRKFTASMALTMGGALSVSACSKVGTVPTEPITSLHQELVRQATLAPSSHNTQCWKFELRDQLITLLPDLSRRCPAVDPDDHHLYVSLGCAAENLTHAALANGLHAESNFDLSRNAIGLALTPIQQSSTPLYEAIATRQCTRGEYDGKSLSNAELSLLERAGNSNGVRMLLLTEQAAMERVLSFVIQSNTEQMADPAFVRELKSWIRFNGAAALQTRDGLFSATSDNPEIPTWLGNLAFNWIFNAKSENDKIAKQMRSSAGIAIFVAPVADKAHWVDVGRSYERFALQATALGIRNAFLNQPVEVQSVRSPFAQAFGLAGQRPDLVVRFGRGAALPRSFRRPITQVLV